MYAGTFKIFRTYWLAYGGSQALLRSFYFHLALILAVATFNTWLTPLWNPTAGQWSAWWDQSLAVLPNVLGFTLGGFAIFMGFGDEKFRQLLSMPDDDQTTSATNAYVGLCASFVHFILVQISALIFAVLAKAWWFYADWIEPIRCALPLMNSVAGFIGYGLFLYALALVAAATMHVFRIATLYANQQMYMARAAKAKPPASH